jgi:hypothetical protein
VQCYQATRTQRTSTVELNSRRDGEALLLPFFSSLFHHSCCSSSAVLSYSSSSSLLSSFLLSSHLPSFVCPSHSTNTSQGYFVIYTCFLFLFLPQPPLLSSALSLSISSQLFYPLLSPPISSPLLSVFFTSIPISVYLTAYHSIVSQNRSNAIVLSCRHTHCLHHL